MIKFNQDNITRLAKVIRQRFALDENFYLGCERKEYYIDKLGRHLPNAKFEELG